MFTDSQKQALRAAVEVAYDGLPSDDPRNEMAGEAYKALKLIEEGNALVFEDAQLNVLYQGMTSAVANALGLQNLSALLLGSLFGIAVSNPEVKIKDLMGMLQKAAGKTIHDYNCGDPHCPIHGDGAGFDIFIIDVELGSRPGPRRTSNRTLESDLKEDR